MCFFTSKYTKMRSLAWLARPAKETYSVLQTSSGIAEGQADNKER